MSPLAEPAGALRASAQSPGDESTVLLPEEDARRVVLVRAVEEADLEGALLSADRREEASFRARPLARTDPAAALAARAAELTSALSDSRPVLARFARVGLPHGAWIVAVALVLGLALNLLGAERRIHVLANPLAVLLLWNVCILSFLSISGLLRGSVRESISARAPALSRALSGLPLKGLQRAIRASETERFSGPLSRAAARFFEDWTRVAAPLAASRLRRVLHTAAIAMTVGALGGMYARGLVLEYQVHWESTFLEAETGQRVLGVVLGPASVLSGIDVPDVARIEAAAPSAGRALGDLTRSTLHLYSLTVLLLVVVPRALLAALASRRARALAAGLALDARSLYYRRLLSTAHGSGLSVSVHPYSFTLSTARTEALEALVRDVFGGAASVNVHPALEYGAEAEDVPSLAGAEDPTPIVVLFNLAQTPELELQGRLLEGLRARAQAGLVALADCSAWRERVGSGPTFGERLDEHRRTWERLAREVGVPIVHVDLEAAPGQELLESIESALEGRVQEVRQETPTT